MAAVGKHFPGHGSSTGDTHEGWVDVTDTWSRTELEPYAAIIRAGLADAVIGHTAARVYPFLQGMDNVFSEIREEATVDSIVEQIAEVRELIHRMGQTKTVILSTHNLAEVQATAQRVGMGWREALARNFALRNQALSVHELNFAVQRTIDRIIFLRMAEDRGVIELPIGRHPVDRKRMSISSRKPRLAETRWEVRERFKSLTLVELNLKTGRTHQARVHCAAINHAILGDPVYAGSIQVRTGRNIAFDTWGSIGIQAI